jgi:hypothetical protein
MGQDKEDEMKATIVYCMFFIAGIMALGFIFMYPSSLYALSKDGLVAYYSLNDGTAKDNSGNGNNGKFLGAPKVVDGKRGKCLYFNGETDGIDVADNSSIRLPDALTVAAWVNIQRFIVSEHPGILWKGERIGWGNYFNYRIATTFGEDIPGFAWGTTTKEIENWFSTGASAINQWAFVCMTADGVTAIAYVAYNGVDLIKPWSPEGNPHSAPKPYNVWEGHPLRIGYGQGSNGDLNIVDYFDGMIDEIAIFNRALNGSEVKELMNEDLSIASVDASGKITTTWGEIRRTK